MKKTGNWPRKKRLQAKTELRTTSSLNPGGSLSRSAPLAAGLGNPEGSAGSRRNEPTAESFWSFVDKSAGPDGCWPWTRSLDSDGYGTARLPQARTKKAHLAAWYWTHGSRPPQGMHLDHTCHSMVLDQCPGGRVCLHRRCCNPAHLEVVTPAVNNMRSHSRTRYNAERTHCVNGHPLSGPNLAREKSRGTRKCRRCAADRQAAAWAKRPRKPQSEDKRFRYDQNLMREQIALIRAAESTIAQAVRVIGCNSDHLSRRVWKETRADVLTRDGGVCVRCGVAEAQEVHHRRSRGSGGSAKPETSFGMANLASLCSLCHQHITEHPDEGYSNGWMLRRHTDIPTAPILYAGRGLVLLRADGSIDPYGKAA